ncbi:hypothetical protein BaRGS_00025849 [Batillaria attramentaria]|uniref:Uncharacterized protein n=1 Tax=Batillaria attramentaria TaxID=370345 RepID=A0ABD0K6J4_9CAEN
MEVGRQKQHQNPDNIRSGYRNELGGEEKAVKGLATQAANFKQTFTQNTNAVFSRDKTCPDLPGGYRGCHKRTRHCGMDTDKTT